MERRRDQLHSYLNALLDVPALAGQCCVSIFGAGQCCISILGAGRCCTSIRIGGLEVCASGMIVVLHFNGWAQPGQYCILTWGGHEVCSDSIAERYCVIFGGSGCIHGIGLMATKDDLLVRMFNGVTKLFPSIGLMATKHNSLVHKFFFTVIM
jgi:hypothetical protein